MSTTYQVEAWPDIKPEMELMLPAHWREVARNQDKVPLDVDWPRYMALHEAGALQCVTARCDGVLVGYHVAIISTHLHYAGTLHGITDVYYVTPEHRIGRTGLRLFEAVERAMHDEMVRLGYPRMKLFTGTKIHLDQSRLLEHLGFSRVEHLYSKMIGD